MRGRIFGDISAEMRNFAAMIEKAILSAAIVAASAGMAARGGELDRKMAREGMVAVGAVCDGVEESLMYSRADNFTGVVLYEGLDSAWLHPDAAVALRKAAEALRKERPDLHLLVKDASRPMSVQRRMYQVVQGTPQAPYVSNPRNGGGLHNYGLAVDITLADSLGRELPMGTPVDHLGPEANIDREAQLVSRGVITAAERANRLLLRRIMQAGGFKPLRTEWWHFNLCTRAEAKQRYRLLNF
ncbi:MAG: M15 family metallopeptidase [Bacteroidales bacterium]|nr:M15 family metallopeptidase [Bacteroidales bacterium]